MFSSIGNVLLLAFGFGFVIFWHELGHFLAAKWADVRVEQFAVGFGQAIFSWRKGLGVRWGSTNADYLKRLRDHAKLPASAADDSTIAPATFNDLPLDDAELTDPRLAAAGKELGISETEYRLNWIPLGGYVKMLGQDDMKPGVTVADPRAYNNKPVGKRMVIVSAGVIMNVILAAILFMYAFSIPGLDVPDPIVGSIVPGSPAMSAYKVVNGDRVPAPLRIGDRIVAMNGRTIYDFDKIKLNTALAGEDAVRIDVARGGDPAKIDHLLVTPTKPPSSNIPMIGVGPIATLSAIPVGEDSKVTPEVKGRSLPELYKLNPGDVVTAVNGERVTDDQYSKLDTAIQAGKSVILTVKPVDGPEKPVEIPVHLMRRFGGDDPDFAGMTMLAKVLGVNSDSSAKDVLRPGDVVTSIGEDKDNGDVIAMPRNEQLLDFIRKAGASDASVRMAVLRDGKPVTATLTPNVKIEPGKKGLGIQLDLADDTLLVAQPKDGTPAKLAKLPAGAAIKAINGVHVDNWRDVDLAIAKLPVGAKLDVAAVVDGKEQTYSLGILTPEQVATVRENRFDSLSTTMLVGRTWTRKGPPLTAAKWGLEETRDAIEQVYLTVRSMVRGQISVKEVSGPVGILGFGYKIAERGSTKLIWFLAIISANLAVMNFLPIPIVDGGLFTFLILEKLKGSPISQRTQAVAQIVGLVLLGTVFVFATYQDVLRLPFLFK